MFFCYVIVVQMIQYIDLSLVLKHKSTTVYFSIYRMYYNYVCI